MTSLLIKDATILTLDADDRIIERGHVAVEDGRIVAVGAGGTAGHVNAKSTARIVSSRRASSTRTHILSRVR